MMKKARIGLFDGSFRHQESVSLGDQNRREKPKYIEWDRDKIHPTTVFTDMHIRNKFAQSEAKHKFAWIIEPDWLLNGDNPEEAMSNFDTIFTSNLDFVERFPDKFNYIQLGGSWIDHKLWGAWDKFRLISMMTTDKQKAPGHRVRRSLVASLKERGIDVDFFGRGSNPIPSKMPALHPYRYSIVVEGYKIPGYFTEKLIDCLCIGAIPIYWGDPRISEVFIDDYWIKFDTAYDLCRELQMYPDKFLIDHYASSLGKIHINVELARQYRCAEDRLFEDYPDAFQF